MDVRKFRALRLLTLLSLSGFAGAQEVVDNDSHDPLDHAPYAAAVAAGAAIEATLTGAARTAYAEAREQIHAKTSVSHGNRHFTQAEDVRLTDPALPALPAELGGLDRVYSLHLVGTRLADLTVLTDLPVRTDLTIDQDIPTQLPSLAGKWFSDIELAHIPEANWEIMGWWNDWRSLTLREVGVRDLTMDMSGRSRNFLTLEGLTLDSFTLAPQSNAHTLTLTDVTLDEPLDLTPLTRLFSLHLSNSPLPSSLAQFEDFEELTLANMPAETLASAPAALAGAGELETVTLRALTLTPDLAAALCALPKLEDLRLKDMDLNAEALAALQCLRGTLETLDLSGSSLPSLEFLRDWKTLRDLSLSGQSPQDLSALGNAQSLRRLTVDNPQNWNLKRLRHLCLLGLYVRDSETNESVRCS